MGSWLPSRRECLGALLWCLLAVLAGLALHGRLIYNAWSSRGALPVAADGLCGPSAWRSVGLEEAVEVLSAGGVLLDTRPAAVFAASPLPLAISVPAAQVGSALATLQANLAVSMPLVLAGLGPGDRGPQQVASLLAEAGYAQVCLYGGAPAELQKALEVKP